MLIFAAVILVAIVVCLAVAINLAAATFAVVVCGTVFAGIAAVGWRPLEALPLLEVGLWHEGALVTEYVRSTERARAPIDVDACVQNAVAEVRRQVPPEVTPAVQLAVYGALGPLREEARANAVVRLEKDLESYEPAIRRWVEAYKERRWPTYATIREKVAVYNGGDSRADGVILRIVLPEGVVAMNPERLDALALGPPPAPPEYVEDMGGIGARIWAGTQRAVEPVVPRSFVLPTPQTSRPRFVRDRGRDVAEVRFENVTHGVTELSAGELAIEALPGVYELAWEAHVSNLRRPARGTIRVEIRDWPKAEPPLTTVREVEASGDVKLDE